MRDAGLLDLNTRQREKHLLRMLKCIAGEKFCHDSAQLLQVCEHIVNAEMIAPDFT